MEADGFAIEGNDVFISSDGYVVEGYGNFIDVDYTGYPLNRVDLNPIRL